jgi:two-component system, chemotaxis family, CheB/CheR fusion protein
VLVNEDYNLVHVSEHAGRFLRFGGGEPTRNLLKVVQPALKLELQSALLEARKGVWVSESRNVRFEISERETFVNITVRLIQAPEAASGFYLVKNDEVKSAAVPASSGEPPQTLASRDALDGLVQGLEAELRATKERLRLTLEQGETSNEELKASNEELQAINEELRSASEELETSKEELQSLNEELTTVNHELKEKINESSQVNADLQNLIGSTDIGTIFLDRALTFKRYTPLVKDLFNIIPSDIGRPLSHLTHTLDYDHLSEDAAEVLATLAMIRIMLKRLARP